MKVLNAQVYWRKLRRGVLPFVLLWGMLNFLIFGVSQAGVFGIREVLIPAGEFAMGSPEGEGQPDERPAHNVYLDAYYIDQFEVTGKDFEKYLEANPKAHPTITGWWGRKVPYPMYHTLGRSLTQSHGAYHLCTMLGHK